MFDPGHVFHNAAHQWFGQNRKHGWASCPITINGCIRILTNINYPVLKQTASQIALDLRDFCQTADHHFWPDSASLLDDTLFQMSAVFGHKNVTDVYLLGLAVHNHGRLATFDRGIPLDAVTKARSSNLVVIRSV
jgi:predicted nucleic acid-binding protein